MEAIYFLVVGVVLYLVSDWILNRIEIGLGKRLEHRSLIFFAILLGLALATFWLIRRFVGAG